MVTVCNKQALIANFTYSDNESDEVLVCSEQQAMTCELADSMEGVKLG